MVTGLELFRAWFAPHAGQYVLIGGTAAALSMAAAGLQILQADNTGKPSFYRFQRPKDTEFPAMLELFTRRAEAPPATASVKLARIPFDGDISSLSAILLNDHYYEFLLMRRREGDGISYAGEDCLIPLKAIAWLELTQLKANGVQIDGKDIRKHANDILRLSQLLSPESRIALPQEIASDMRKFIAALRVDRSLDCRKIGISNVTTAELIDRLALAYQLDT